MHGFVTMAHPLVEAILTTAKQHADTAEVVLCPPAILIPRLAEWLMGTVVKLGGQDCHTEAHGAFTGSISAPMLVDADCEYVIVGHSERRLQHHETNTEVCKKADSAIKADLIPIICIGETADERAGGNAEAVVGRQVTECLPDEAISSDFVLAYEPVWAIGSGKVPSSDDIRKMHATIQSVASKRIGLKPAQVRVLYGGSVNAANASEIMAIEGVAGVLVGGASLKAEDFCRIVESAEC